MRNENEFRGSRPAPVAVVLGTNDVASAVACALFRAGFGVVLSRDPMLPVLRRTMAFDDALVGGAVTLEGVTARGTASLVEVMRAFVERGHVSVTALDLSELLCLGLMDVLVDARMRMRTLKVDLRPFARATIGLGPGFEAGRHVDVAVETAPEAIAALHQGATLAPHGRSAPLGGAGRERFARAPAAGFWETDKAIGDPVVRGEAVGACAGLAVRAPLSGRLRGLVRSGTDVPAGLKLAEVDPRVSGPPSWIGLADRPRRIAEAVLDALATLDHMAAGLSVLPPH